mmetsp:Transcript_3096/g.7186  ORF Transcript_3096/g.7186 Transcript_3096/m.7186 type:complete len:334 (-) Transcript_3096:3225-4226(-)
MLQVFPREILAHVRLRHVQIEVRRQGFAEGEVLAVSPAHGLRGHGHSVQQVAHPNHCLQLQPRLPPRRLHEPVLVALFFPRFDHVGHEESRDVVHEAKLDEHHRHQENDPQIKLHLGHGANDARQPVVEKRHLGDGEKRKKRRLEVVRGLPRRVRLALVVKVGASHQRLLHLRGDKEAHEVARHDEEQAAEQQRPAQLLEAVEHEAAAAKPGGLRQRRLAVPPQAQQPQQQDCVQHFVQRGRFVRGRHLEEDDESRRVDRHRGEGEPVVPAEVLEVQVRLPRQAVPQLPQKREVEEKIQQPHQGRPVVQLEQNAPQPLSPSSPRRERLQKTER